MAKDTYSGRKKGESELPPPNLYSGQRPLTLRERLEQNPALKNARERQADDGGASVVEQTQSEPQGQTPSQNRSEPQPQPQIETVSPQIIKPARQAASAYAHSLKATRGSDGQAEDRPETEGSGAERLSRPDIAGGRTTGKSDSFRGVERRTGSGQGYMARRDSADRSSPIGDNDDPDSISKKVQVNQNAQVDEIVERLANALEAETLLYRDAAEISAKKTDVIVKGKIEELDSLVKAEQAIILKIGKVETARERAIEQLSQALNLDLDGITLTEINSRIGEQSFQRLNSCQQNLVETLGGLKNTNDMNAQLIQNALDYVNFSVNILTSDQNAGNMYSQAGEEDNPTNRKNIFDIKL